MPSYRFSRGLRLLRPTEFRRVFDRPRRMVRGGLVVLARCNDLGHPRLGLALSRKSLPLAVDRNRVKRVARELVRQLQHRLGGIDFVVMSRRGLQCGDKRRLRQTLKTQLTALATECERSC